MENNIKICECCNKSVDELKKTYVNDSPIEEQNIVSSYWLCHECFSLRFADPEAFLEKIREN